MSDDYAIWFGSFLGVAREVTMSTGSVRLWVWYIGCLCHQVWVVSGCGTLGDYVIWFGSFLGVVRQATMSSGSGRFWVWYVRRLCHLVRVVSGCGTSGDYVNWFGSFLGVVRHATMSSDSDHFWVWYVMRLCQLDLQLVTPRPLDDTAQHCMHRCSSSAQLCLIFCMCV